MRDLLTHLYLVYHIEPKVSYYCNTNCSVEPPAMVYKCPGCDDYTPKVHYTYSYPNDKWIQRIIEIITDTDNLCHLHIKKLNDGYAVSYWIDDIQQFEVECNTLIECLIECLICLAGVVPESAVEELLSL
jgi:hypothetical protein